MAKQDKNFDSLATKFSKNIYGTAKGQIRIEVLKRDLFESIPSLTTGKLRILDAGGGFGYLSQQLAELGHSIVLCDISAEMLALAEQQIQDNEKVLDITIIQSSIQDLSVEALGQFDLVLCHAVVEWLVDAKATVKGLLDFLKPNGYLSLMFYNKEAQRFHSLVSGNFDYVEAGLKVKKPVRLTPQYPLFIEDVESWIEEWGFQEVCRSGVRVINDYLKLSKNQTLDNAQLIRMELEYSKYKNYIPLGRYVHIIGQSE
ncbi:methyltransferase domain-containing protein [Parashewanella curva]|uniref:tRNA 5-carboxymethoxyuridine methyltransferase n=1 Tax=Parashewanella curva TaxID=2338552 RepID=A0A3L8PRV2_9GAMM|nr:methyltransferase domain-containing protein [Parashewanella curva]RLV58147.1 methyltransferase domain-containing protein [Parashewanella curva]